jgi:cellulose synthase/poly-beta-1,6-N-acetylglucosamine synthase-like glycosyltransferase
VAGGLSPLAVLASALLWLLEAVAFVIAASFVFESCDVSCRSRWSRAVPVADPAYRPKVSLHVPAFAEPPDMLIETIASLEALEYPDFEVVVIDNNTTDESLWRPVAEYCRHRDRVRFVHVAPWPGYKSGALNLALRSHTDPAAEIIGVVDADYVVRHDYLARTVGHFADHQIAFLETPQDYRKWEGDRYLTACHDAYRYFFDTAMPSRNERNSIIFGGTMGLIRRSVLDELGGWDEWCITEDAEASLRMLRAGHTGLYINESFGQGLMPLSFAALKRQMFRWCFGGIQLLRKHHRSFAPEDGTPTASTSPTRRSAPTRSTRSMSSSSSSPGVAPRTPPSARSPNCRTSATPRTPGKHGSSVFASQP